MFQEFLHCFRNTTPPFAHTEGEHLLTLLETFPLKFFSLKKFKIVFNILVQLNFGDIAAIVMKHSTFHFSFGHSENWKRTCFA